MNRDIKVSLVFFAGMFISNVSHAASFDCAKASSSAEKLICSSKVTGELDVEMSRLFFRLRDDYKGDGKTSFVNAHKKWLRDDRDKCPSIDCVALTIWQQSGTYRTSLERGGIQTKDIPDVADSAQSLDRLLHAEQKDISSTIRARNATSVMPSAVAENSSVSTASPSTKSNPNADMACNNMANIMLERTQQWLASSATDPLPIKKDADMLKLRIRRLASNWNNSELLIALLDSGIAMTDSNRLQYVRIYQQFGAARFQADAKAACIQMARKQGFR